MEGPIAGMFIYLRSGNCLVMKSLKWMLQKLVNQLREVLGNSMPSDSTKRIIDNSKDSVQRVNRFLKVAMTDLQWCSEKLGELHVFHQQLQTVFQMKPTEALQMELMGH